MLGEIYPKLAVYVRVSRVDVTMREARKRAIGFRSQGPQPRRREKLQETLLSAVMSGMVKQETKALFS